MEIHAMRQRDNATVINACDRDEAIRRTVALTRRAGVRRSFLIDDNGFCDYDWLPRALRLAGLCVRMHVFLCVCQMPGLQLVRRGIVRAGVETCRKIAAALGAFADVVRGLTLILTHVCCGARICICLLFIVVCCKFTNFIINK